MQSDYIDYGEEAFFYKELETGVPQEGKYIREQYWMDKFDTYNEDSGYNISPTAGTTLGVKRRESSKLKMSASHMGKVLTEEHRRAISIAHKGKVKSEEHQDRITESLRNRDSSIYARGSRTGGAVLDDSKVIEILEKLSTGKMGTVIAREYGVTGSAISAIKHGKTWTHIPRIGEGVAL